MIAGYCSTDETYNIRATELTTYLLKRGYKRDFITKQIQRTTHIPAYSQINKPKRIPFITTYNPSLPSTKLRLKDRLMNTAACTLGNLNTKYKPTTVAEHCVSSPYNVSNDLQLIPILRKTFSNRDSVRPGKPLISKGRTIDPNYNA